MIRVPHTLRAGQMAALAAVACLAAAANAAATPRPPCPPAAEHVAPPLPAFDAATSLLVVAPHPDDETLCCGGVIQRVLASGGRVSVVWITSGDAGRRDRRLLDLLRGRAAPRALALGATRMAEARAATTRLGVAPAGQIFLGYPDGGIAALLGDFRTQPYASRATAVAAVPYADVLARGHPYTGASLERDFGAVLDAVEPTLVIAPSPLDAHPDHRAVGRLARDGAGARPQPPRVVYYVIHGGEGWPQPRGRVAGIPLTVAPRARDLPFTTFDVTPAEEDRKQAALAAYATQMQTLAPLLLAFVRTTELYTPQAGVPP